MKLKVFIIWICVVVASDAALHRFNLNVGVNHKFLNNNSNERYY